MASYTRSDQQVSESALGPTTQYALPTQQTPLIADEGRRGFLVNVRVRIGVAFVFVSALLVLATFILAEPFNTGGNPTETMFDLAKSPTAVAKPGVGFVLGPLLILIVLAGMFRRGFRIPHDPRSQETGEVPVSSRPFAGWTDRVQFGYRRSYWTRFVIALVLWVVGYVVLFVSVGSLSGDYAIKSGTYILGGLLGLGLISTIAAVPFHLSAARIYRLRLARPALVQLQSPAPVQMPPPQMPPPQMPPPQMPPPQMPPPQMPPPQMPPGWYSDPARRHQYRYWDGTTWTEHAADQGAQAIDPLEQRTE